MTKRHCQPAKSDHVYWRNQPGGLYIVTYQGTHHRVGNIGRSFSTFAREYISKPRILSEVWISQGYWTPHNGLAESVPLEAIPRSFRSAFEWPAGL